jgi:hypothetical protein
MSFRTRVFLLLPLLAVAACAPSSSVGSPAPDGSVTYLVRLGNDTVAVEQYRRAGNRIESEIVQHFPATYVGRSVIDLTSAGLATSWTYEPRLVTGARPPGAASRTLTFGPDSVTVVSDTGAQFQFRRRVAGGPAIPNLGNSMLTWELAIAYARMQGGDSVNVPTVGAAGGRGLLPIRFITKDSVRSYLGGPDWPVYITLDSRGHIVRYNGTATTLKTVGAPVAAVDVRTLATRLSVRDQTTGAMGPASTRDTVRAQVSGSQLWIDYGRPALRGRDPWVNGVLGDTLWRTGANAATQFKTDADLAMGGQIIPAGIYTLWTHVFPRNAGYELVFNRQVGQWGTIHDPTLDVYRVPLGVQRAATSAERFTMTIEPLGGGGVIAMQWGTTRLEAPFTIVRKD